MCASHQQRAVMAPAQARAYMLATAIVVAALVVQPGAADMMHRPRPTPPWDSVESDWAGSADGSLAVGALLVHDM